MAATIFYTITNGAMPVTVELTPSFIPANVHTETGTYSFINVEDGEYTLVFTDSNGCVHEKEIIVDPFVTTTTTTIVPGDRMVVGQSQDTLLIFNEDATNRSEHYFGDTPVDTNIMLYLWFKTLNGEPLASNRTVSYSITATGSMLDTVTTGSTTATTFVDNFTNSTYLGVTGLTSTGDTGYYFTGYVKINDVLYTGISYTFIVSAITVSAITGTSGVVHVSPIIYTGLPYDGNSQFTYLDVSDQIHAEVIESMSGPSKTIAGTISFQAGFIETYFKYRYSKDLIIPDYQIDLNAYTNWLDPNISLTGGTNTYGVIYVDGDNMILKF